MSDYHEWIDRQLFEIMDAARRKVNEGKVTIKHTPFKATPRLDFIPSMVYSPANDLWWGQPGIFMPLWKWKYQKREVMHVIKDFGKLAIDTHHQVLSSKLLS